jgi:hypothetical protein
MKHEDNDDGAGRAARPRVAALSEALLRAEIGFWRELLDESAGTLPPDSMERMRQALALAEHRFLQLCRNAGESGRSSDRLPGTSRCTGRNLH